LNGKGTEKEYFINIMVKKNGFWLSDPKRVGEYNKSNLQYSTGSGGKVGRRGSNSKARHTVVFLRDGDTVITENQQRAIRKKGIALPKHRLAIKNGQKKPSGAGIKALLLPNEIVLSKQQARSVEAQGGKLPTWGLQNEPGPIKRRGDKGGCCRVKKKKKKK